MNEIYSKIIISSYLPGIRTMRRTTRAAIIIYIRTRRVSEFTFDSFATRADLNDYYFECSRIIYSKFPLSWSIKTPRIRSDNIARFNFEGAVPRGPVTIRLKYSNLYIRCSNDNTRIRIPTGERRPLGCVS